MTSSYYSAIPALSWRDSAVLRVAGSAVSWFLFALAFTLLFQVSFSVMALGGSCASGGPYEIAVECPDAVAAFAPGSIFMGLAAVGIGMFFARGFGTPLTTWAWPILFCGLGGLFLAAFFAAGEVVGLIIGLMFEIMGLVPLILEFRGSPQRVFLGQRAANGAQFYEGERARRSLMSPRTPNPEGAVRPNAGHWLLALGITAVCSLLGYWVAGVWFASVASSGS
ncbi:MAG: hypothetical protein JWR04_323 [Rhodoglobus sp.]|nr:hypothetical protein [Rhodoglobus sp.]